MSGRWDTIQEKLEELRCKRIEIEKSLIDYYTVGEDSTFEEKPIKVFGKYEVTNLRYVCDGVWGMDGCSQMHKIKDIVLRARGKAGTLTPLDIHYHGHDYIVRLLREG